LIKLIWSVVELVPEQVLVLFLAGTTSLWSGLGTFYCSCGPYCM